MRIERLIVVLALAACTPTAADKREGSGTASVGIELDAIDRAVAPGDNFFAFANGAWIKRTQIPPDRASYGTGAMMAELTDRRTVELIKQAAAAPGGDADARKIGDYYTSFMDEQGIEAKGLAPLEPTLERVRAISDARSLAAYLGSTLRADVDVLNATELHTQNLFGLWVAQDLDEPSHYSAFLLQGGLVMPDREYYLDPSPRMAEIRRRYQAHIGAMLRLAGVAEPDARAARVFELEVGLARVHATRADSEDVEKGNNHWKRAELDTRAPGLDWKAFLEAARLADLKELVVWQPAAVTGISAMVRDQPLDTWKEYLTYVAIEHVAGFLPRAFVDEAFAFHGKVLLGTEKLRDRWKRAVDAVSDALGEVVGKLYVSRYFPPSEKARAEAMVRNEVAAFHKRIDRLDWMAPETKAKAKAKLAVLKVGVGYPDKWRDYSGLEVVRGDALGNARRASLFEYHRNLKKLGQPVDRSEWVMNPQLVNAVNLPAMNALNFPAAILQPPDFDPRRPAVMDYGAAGATIGHEISHSFDDQGALFDDKGRLHNWWTKEDLAHFKAAAQSLIKQYDSYRPFADLGVNGKLTVSENIADLAGLAVAYDAYRISLGGREAEAVHGLTGDQQFFLSFAQSWKQKIREPALRKRLHTDPHAPAEYRADTVRNLDAWYTAFDVKAGQKLYLAPDQRVRVW
jgi:putative endopeptidase